MNVPSPTTQLFQCHWQACISLHTEPSLRVAANEWPLLSSSRRHSGERPAAAALTAAPWLRRTALTGQGKHRPQRTRAAPCTWTAKAAAPAGEALMMKRLMQTNDRRPEINSHHPRMGAVLYNA